MKEQMKFNGNKFVETKPHVFIPGKGCYFESKETAISEGVGLNGHGVWFETISFDNKEWFQAGQMNVWD